jgi:hypothetical protein
VPGCLPGCGLNAFAVVQPVPQGPARLERLAPLIGRCASIACTASESGIYQEGLGDALDPPVTRVEHEAPRGFASSVVVHRWTTSALFALGALTPRSDARQAVAALRAPQFRRFPPTQLCPVTGSPVSTVLRVRIQVHARFPHSLVAVVAGHVQVPPCSTSRPHSMPQAPQF